MAVFPPFSPSIPSSQLPYAPHTLLLPFCSEKGGPPMDIMHTKFHQD